MNYNYDAAVDDFRVFMDKHGGWNEPRYAYIDGEKFEFIHGELWETEITPRPSND